MVATLVKEGLNMERIRVLLVDDHLKYRMALLVALAQEPSLEIVGEASDGNEAVEKAKALHPDVVLMDLHMPECNGDEATKRLQAELPGTNVVINTISDQESDLVNALKCGARGYLLKNEDPEMVVQAMHYVARGGHHGVSGNGGQAGDGVQGCSDECCCSGGCTQ